MISSGAEMATEKLDRIYFCARCRMVFLFKSDAVEHQEASRHTKISEMSF